MRQRFAPSHDLLAKARFIPADDGAWDMARIDAECAKLEKKAVSDHPFWRYIFGTTRFDLDADGVRDYLDASKAPETWVLRRLKWEDREQIAHLERMGRHESAMRTAFLRGVDSLENAEGPAGRALIDTLRKYPRDDQAVIEAVENYAAAVIVEIGGAVMLVSQDLSSEEKKVCATPPGASSAERKMGE